MSTAPRDVRTSPANAAEIEPRTSHGDVVDGRVQRRRRNERAVRSAILDLSEDGTTVSFESIAERAGVAVRSIYRYYGDLDTAIAEARAQRVEELQSMIAGHRQPPTSWPISDRLEVILDQRVELERLGRPLRYVEQPINPHPAFDRFVADTFAAEIAALPDDQRDCAREVISWVLRPRAIRDHLDASGDIAATRKVITFTVLAALGGTD